MKTKQNKKLLILSILLMVILALFMILNWGEIGEFIAFVMRVLRPVIIGVVLAYLCNPIFRVFERKLFYKVRPYGFRRGLSLLCTYIVLGLIFVILLMLIVPQLVSSILDFFANYKEFVDTALANVNDIITTLNQSFGTEIAMLESEAIQQALDELIKNLDIEAFLGELITLSTLSSVWLLIENLFSIITDTILGLFISLYILSSKEKQYAQVMRMRKALFNSRINERITNICTIADKSFGGFIRGKMLDSTIVGVLVYIIISIMQVPYSLLIAVVIGITDFVPVVGPFIGVIPSAVIILLTDPIKVIPFLLCILIVQQIDGNIIAPKILGENTGVSSLCVMIAITVMGAIWGLAGMVLGVPLFATVLEIGGNYLNKRLQNKGIAPNTENAPAEDAVASKKEQRYVKKHPTLSDGLGSLTADEENTILACRLAKKHLLTDEGERDNLSAFAAEYLANKNIDTRTSEQTESPVTETLPEV